VPAPTPLAPLTTTQLDEAELDARLVLNKLNADSTERLQVARSATGVQVSGIVPTDERKEQLEAGLEGLAHVTASISSFEDVKSKPLETSEITSVRSASVVADTPVLASYLIAKGKSPEESARLSQELFTAAVTTQQEARAIADLINRFDGGEALTENGAATLEELLARHQKSLIAALEEEEKVLAGTGIGLSLPQPFTIPSESSLDAVSAAEKNLRLCKELTSGSSNTAQDVERDVSEILDSTARLRSFARALIEIRKSVEQGDKP
jgi:hypothetical protein